MAIVERKYGATITRGADLSDNLRDVAPDLWPDVIAEYRMFCQRSLPTDCRNLLRMVSEGEHTQWAGYGDRVAYLREGLGIEPDAADWALHGLEIAGVEAPIGYEQAQRLGKHGGDRRSEQAKADQPDNIILKYGTDPAYLVLRLHKKNRPDLAAKVEAKTMSARAAAIAAGIIVPPTKLAKALKEFQHLTPEDRKAFLDATNLQDRSDAKAPTPSNHHRRNRRVHR